jgi:hypothetical protein
MRGKWTLCLAVAVSWSCSDPPRELGVREEVSTAPNEPSHHERLETAQPNPGEYIGLRYAGSHEGLDNLGGALLDYTGELEYALSLMAAASEWMLWLERHAHRDEAGTPHWEVRAALVLPPLGAGETVLYGGLCRIDGVPDPEIVAVAVEGDEELLTTIRFAWRADRALERFEAVATAGVACENEGYGV